jgi:SAM-dependent methyltransferase
MSVCLLCGSGQTESLHRLSDRLYRTTDRLFTVARCTACGLTRLDPAPAPEELGAYYPSDYWFSGDEDAAGRLEEAYRRLVLRDHVGFVARALRGAAVHKPVIDVGCGGGLFLGMMRERGFRVAGLDLSPQAARIAWRRQGVPAACGVLAHSPFAACAASAVTMFHVIEHLDDPRPHLIEARRLLDDRGPLVVQAPDAGSWQARLLGRAWNGLDVPRHLFDYRASDLERLLESCGFRVTRRKHFSLRDNPAGLASSLAPGLDPMARRVRRLPEAKAERIAKDLVYLGIAAAALPFTLLEAAFGAGSTIMVEARKR